MSTDKPVESEMRFEGRLHRVITLAHYIMGYQSLGSMDAHGELAWKKSSERLLQRHQLLALYVCKNNTLACGYALQAVGAHYLVSSQCCAREGRYGIPAHQYLLTQLLQQKEALQ